MVWQIPAKVHTYPGAMQKDDYFEIEVSVEGTNR